MPSMTGVGTNVRTALPPTQIESEKAISDRHGMWLFGYRHLEVETEGGGAQIRLTMSGPHVGYGFRF